MEDITQVLASISSSDLLHQVFSSDLNMDDDDDVSTIGSQEQSWVEGRSLQTYLDSIPYEGESIEEMQTRLEFIISRLYIAARAKNWELVTTWDGPLQWYAQRSYFAWTTDPSHVFV